MVVVFRLLKLEKIYTKQISLTSFYFFVLMNNKSQTKSMHGHIIRSRCLQMFYKIGILKNFANIAGKYLVF